MPAFWILTMFGDWFKCFAQGHGEIDNLRDYEVEPNLQHREMVVRYTNKAGQQRFKGGADLRSSQSYPRRPFRWIKPYVNIPIGTY